MASALSPLQKEIEERKRQAQIKLAARKQKQLLFLQQQQQATTNKQQQLYNKNANKEEEQRTNVNKNQFQHYQPANESNTKNHQNQQPFFSSPQSTTTVGISPIVSSNKKYVGNNRQSPYSRPPSFYNNNQQTSNLNSNSKLQSPSSSSSSASASASHNPNLNLNSGGDITTISCQLISCDRFEVEMSKYCEAAIVIFKSMPSRLYDLKTKKWSFALSDYESLLNKLIKMKNKNVAVGQIPKYVFNCLISNSRSLNANFDLNKIDKELRQALMPFQMDGVLFGINKNGRCLIGDEMGLGKTFQALAIACYYKNDFPLLIVTTASMKTTWEETILKYLPSIPAMQVQYMVSKKCYIGDSKILIVSHDLMSRVEEKLLEKKFGVLIIDESHVIKNFKAKCTKVAMALSKKAKRVVLLSGTPALSRPSELYTQLTLINDSFFGGFFNFSKRYCDGRSTNFGWDASGKSNLTELGVLLNKEFMIRRTKDQVLNKEIPDKKQELVKLNVNLNQLSDEEKEALASLATKYEKEKKGVDKHALLLSFFAETAKIKIPAVCAYLITILKNGANAKTKFLIFAHHQVMLNAICDLLRRNEVRFMRIDGSTPSNQRKSLVDLFQGSDFDSCQCGVLSITAANAGITLTAASLILFAELHWNPSILSQAEARAHRIGQQNGVTVRYLIAEGTADDKIWPMLQDKQKILEEVGLSSNKESLKDLGLENATPTKNKENDRNKNKISAYFSPSPSLNNKKTDYSNLFEEDGIDDEDFALFKTQQALAQFNSLNKQNNDDNNKENKFGGNFEEFFDDGLDDVLSNIDL